MKSSKHYKHIHTARARRQFKPSERLSKLLEYDCKCGVCGHEIEERFSWPHPGGFTLDHIIPFAQGGPDTLDNLRPVHSVCNLLRGSHPKITQEQASTRYLDKYSKWTRSFDQ